MIGHKSALAIWNIQSCLMVIILGNLSARKEFYLLGKIKRNVFPSLVFQDFEIFLLFFVFAP